MFHSEYQTITEIVAENEEGALQKEQENKSLLDVCSHYNINVMGYKLLHGPGNLALPALEKSFGASCRQARHAQLFKSAFADNDVLPDSLKQVSIGVTQPESAAELLEILTLPNSRRDLVLKHLGKAARDRYYNKEFLFEAKKKSKDELLYIFKDAPGMLEQIKRIF